MSLKERFGTFLDRNVLLEKILESDPEAHLFANEEGKIIYANPAAFSLFPCLQTDCQGEAFERLLKNGEVEIQQDDGSVRLVVIRTNKVFWGEQIGYSIFARDITKVRQQDQMLRLLSRVFTEASDGMTVTDVHAQIQIVNQAFTETTGYRAEEAVGKNPRILQSGKHSPSFYSLMWSSLMQTGHWEGEIWNRRKNGEIYPEWLQISAIKDINNETSNYVAVFRDISADVRLRKEIQMAGELQAKLLRQNFTRHDFEVKLVFHPFKIISADYCDYRWFPQQKRFSGCLFDVMGHGVAAGSLVAGFRVLYRQVAEKDLAVHQQLVWLNNESKRVLPEDMFTAAILFEFYPESGLLRWSTAGISKFLICKQGNISWQFSEGIFLGILPEPDYEMNEVVLQHGDWVVFFSDGIGDALEIWQQDNGLIKVQEPQELIDLFHHLIADGVVADDATAMVLKFITEDKKVTH